MINNQKATNNADGESPTMELLLTPDGRILVHNLTSAFAELLHDLDPGDQEIISRIVHPVPTS